MTKRSFSLIAVTILLALVLSIIPLPIDAKAYRPDWLLIVLLYWSLALPHRVNVGVAWLSGLILDVLLGSVLGLHAMVMALTVYICATNYQKIRNFSVGQQALIVSLFSALTNLMIFWVERFISNAYFSPSYLWPVVTTMVMWPWAFFVLRKLRRQFRVS